MGDLIRLDRLIEFTPEEYWDWGSSGIIDLNDISVALHDALPEISEPYGDTWLHPVIEQKTRDWHIGRILYFINRPNEIKDIEIDNQYAGDYILPQPVITDGWHRYAAARWLYDRGELYEISCIYSGRLDLLDYLKGTVDDFERDVI